MTSATVELPALRLANSSAKRWTTFAKANTARDPPDRPSRSDCRRRAVRESICDRPARGSPPRRPAARRRVTMREGTVRLRVAGPPENVRMPPLAPCSERVRPQHRALRSRNRLEERHDGARVASGLQRQERPCEPRDRPSARRRQGRPRGRGRCTPRRRNYTLRISPPSMRITLPVTYEDRGLAINAANAANSSASP